MSCRPERTHKRAHPLRPAHTHLNYSQSMQVLQCWVLQLPLTWIFQQLKTYYTHHHNHHHCHLLFTALMMPLQVISTQNKSHQIDCACSDNTTSRMAQGGQTLLIWLKETLTEFYVCVCLSVCACASAMLLPGVFGLGKSVMLVISNLPWFPELNLAHLDCLRIKFTSLTYIKCTHCVCVYV